MKTTEIINRLQNLLKVAEREALEDQQENVDLGWKKDVTALTKAIQLLQIINKEPKS